jgi:hypothetical protein
MSICTIHTPFRHGDLMSDGAARRRVAHLRPAARSDAPTSLGGPADRATSYPAGTPQILRRWSIAELIAAATWSREAA